VTAELLLRLLYVMEVPSSRVRLETGYQFELSRIYEVDGDDELAFLLYTYRWICVEYYLLRVRGIIRLLDQLDLIGRTSELARLFGIQFLEVLSRGSQVCKFLVSHCHTPLLCAQKAKQHHAKTVLLSLHCGGSKCL
jgi:hypothetical protein